MLFAVLGGLGLIVPVVTAAFSGAEGTAVLRRARTWPAANDDTVTMVVLFVFGGVFSAKGSGVLLG